MISFDKKTKVFKLDGKEYSYIFRITGKNVLQHIYFGKALPDADLFSALCCDGDWAEHYLDGDNAERDYDKGYYDDHALCELAPHGVADKSGAAVVTRKESGSTATEYLYKSHRIYKGKPRLDGMPYTRGDDAETLELTLAERFGGTELVLSYTVFPELDVLARNTRIKNAGNKAETLIRAYSSELDLPSADYDFIHFYGDWIEERYVSRKSVLNGRIEISSNFGRSSHEYNPFGILCDKTATETSGEAYAFSFVYSGNFTLSANSDKWRRTRVMLGINDEDFAFVLNPGEEFTAPEALTAYSARGLEGISHAMHDLVRDRLIRYKNAAAPRPILFNSWEGCYFDFDTQSILEYIDNAKDIGAELFVLDDGWFGKRDNDASSLGDWFVNDKKIDLKRVIEKCHALGMKFGIWFEPEMINPDSELFRAHPEYALGRTGGDRSLWRHQLVLDTSNGDAVDCIFAAMSAVLDKYDIDYIKWDHNRAVSEILGAKAAYGEAYHKIILGCYDLLERLQKKYPDVFFEGCASGGGRFDLGMLYYTPQIWTSDETDPVQRLFIQYGTSYAYPLSTMGAHISKNKNMSYTGKGNVAMFGTYGMEMNPCLLSEDERREVRELNDIYKKYHHAVIDRGDFYRLLSPFEGNYTAMMSVSKDKKQALVLFANFLTENNRYRFLRLRGLDADKNYKNSLDGTTHSGAYYMQVGLNFTKRIYEFQTALVVLEQA